MLRPKADNSCTVWLTQTCSSVDVQRVFVQDPGMPKPQALWVSHYAHRVWPNFWHGDLHLYVHSHGSLPGTRTSEDVSVDCWDWRPVTLGEILERMAAAPADVRP
jgi:hypothetical protein